MTNMFPALLDVTMTARKVSNSDMARAIYGTRINRRGYPEARGRDHVLHWRKGDITPDDKSVAKIAAVLKVPAETLQLVRDNDEFGLW
jgi:hypothetical protein